MPDKPNEKRADWLRGVIEAATAELEGGERQVRWEGVGWREPWSSMFHDTCEYRAKPQPKYRPYLPTEAAEHLGREAIYKINGCGPLTMTLDTVSQYEVRFVWTDHQGNHDAHWSYDSLDAHKWKDDGSPCGVLLEGE